MKTIIEVKRTKDCKHSIVFSNKDQNVSFYIPKEIVGSNPGSTLWITISDKKEE